MTIPCLNCGAAMDAGASACPACGARRRSRLGGAARWGTRGQRRAAALTGLLLGLLVAGYLGWRIATQGRGPDDPRPVPVNPAGADRR